MTRYGIARGACAAVLCLLAVTACGAAPKAAAPSAGTPSAGTSSAGAPSEEAVSAGAVSAGEGATAIPSALLSQARPIGTGPRFHPPATGPVIGQCAAALGPRDGVHVEVFASDRVLLLPAGIGVKPPRTLLDGRITGARCYGALVTLDPTGLVLVRPGAGLTLGTLFRSWGQPLTPTELTSFPAPAGTTVTVYVNGKLWRGAPSAVPLTRHAEIVLEVGPHVPPHTSYAFPAGT